MTLLIPFPSGHPLDVIGVSVPYSAICRQMGMQELTAITAYKIFFRIPYAYNYFVPGGAQSIRYIHTLIRQSDVKKRRQTVA